MADIIRRLFVDVDTGTLYRNFNDFAPAAPLIISEDDKYKMDVVFVKQTGYAAFPMEVFPATYADYPVTNLRVGDGTDTIYNDGAVSAIPAPVLSIGTTVGSYFTFSIDQQAIYGSFTLTLTKSSPSLSVTTAPITYPFTSSDIETAIKNAINGAAGWSAATCTVIPTGGLSGQIKAGGTYSSTVYDLATASTTMTKSSSLYGFNGFRFNFWAEADDVVGYLGTGVNEKAATMQITLNDFVVSYTNGLVVTQSPVTIRRKI